MKFTVAVPLVALLTALILALLTLLAGIKPAFMPGAYIVRILDQDPSNADDPGSSGTAHPDNRKEDPSPC
ncbi:hypothetical protein UCDDA912_g01452 [Diaporthe ampelina]|uniref:Uncharacterized protein n=1 Tax=Diaporthe ampelina TaxID=1214573 RepID=A0A0G2IF74_9PEZI|nr:hypothetical protein UCDDA912_g01452 [Diaporthe ampelina]